jgi:polar amino acid transport system substrate-binding protein
LLLSTPLLAAEPAVLRFATEDWPPFFSAALPGNGLTGSLVEAVLQRMDATARFDYFPWKRAMHVGLNDRRYAGALAMFRTAEREKMCYFSSAVGSRQTVLAYLKDQPVAAARLEDLRGMRIGTVAGYSNGESFDALVRSSLLTVEEGLNNDMNLRKLLHQRFRAIVVEKRMLRYTLARGGYSQADQERIAIDEHLFPERPVHICFQRTAEGLKRQRAFDEAAREIDLARIERDYWRTVGQARLLPPRQ